MKLEVYSNDFSDFKSSTDFYLFVFMSLSLLLKRAILKSLINCKKVQTFT